VAGTTALRRWTWVLGPVLLAGSSCTSVDPGPQFVVPQQVFDANYFYCHVEPGLIFTYSCGPGDPSKGDPSSGGCHYTPAVVSGMVLFQHDPIDCGGGDVPLDPTTVAFGSPANNNFQSVSFEMAKDYTQSALFTRPSSVNGAQPPAHPRAVFDQGDATVNQLLSTWASK
jgi:hypothetical protein